MTGLTIITAAGEVIDTDENAGPFQLTPEGFNSGLSANSVPLAQWNDGNPGSFAQLYRTQPWVYISVNFMTRQLSRLPLKVYEKDSQNVKRQRTDGGLYDLLNKPAPRKGPIHFKQWLSFPTLLHGTSTVHKIREQPGGAPRRFAPLDWRFMDPRRDSDGNITHWIYSGNATRQVIYLEDLLSAAWMAPSDDEIGTSPLQALGITTSLERAAQQWMQGHFRNSARPSGGITMPDAAVGDKELRRELRDDLQRLHVGGTNNGRPMLLPPGSEWQPFGQTAHEVELIDHRKLNREETAAAYNAPQPLIGILDHATYSNVAELHKIVYGPVLGPWLVLFEETIKAQVIDGEPEFEGQFVEFELREVLKGDALKEAIALKTQMQSGLLTINEARQIQNLPPIDHPDCNKPMIPTNNMTFVGGSSTDNANGAVARNLARVANRLYRSACAGEDGWDAARFHRELLHDLRAEGHADAEQTAKTWTAAIGAIVSDALGDAEVLRTSFAALITDSGADPR